MNLMWVLLGIFNYRLSENLQLCERLKWLKSSPLMKSELKHLCECLTTSQPKHLFYIHILVEEVSPELPRPLPDNMLGNLQTLVIEIAVASLSHSYKPLCLPWTSASGV